MLTNYATKLIRPSPWASRAVCPICREPGRLEIVRVHDKAQPRGVGCRCNHQDGTAPESARRQSLED